MIIDPLILIFMAVTILVLAGVLVYLVHSYSHTAQELHRAQQINLDMQKQLGEKPIKLLEHAHEQAQEIINQANKHANDILASSKAYEDTSNTELKEKLANLEQQQTEVFNKASSEMKLAYQNMLTQIQEQDINTLKTMTKDIQEDVLADFKEFRSAMEKETINSEKIVKEKIDEEYLAMQKDLEDYEKQKYQKIDEDIYKILYRVSEMVLSQGISFENHKLLVLEALETAKKEQVFK